MATVGAMRRKSRLLTARSAMTRVSNDSSSQRRYAVAAPDRSKPCRLATSSIR
jgi:hypothetical protein